MEIMKKAVFLDRDGVINVDNGYVHTWREFIFCDGAIEAMKKISEMGFLIIIVTNQSGIARGLYGEEEVKKLNSQLCEFLLTENVTVTSVEFCPHHTQGVVAEYSLVCDCRKPSPGMILNATRRYDISLPDSVMIGDRESDVQAGKNAGVGTNYIVGNSGANASCDGMYVNLLECVLLGPIFVNSGVVFY
jgi:D-glycero-D-manno-heptose 1,7-bisphosphate phosphatase